MVLVVAEYENTVLERHRELVDRESLSSLSSEAVLYEAHLWRLGDVDFFSVCLNMKILIQRYMENEKKMRYMPQAKKQDKYQETEFNEMKIL
jgi:hypothetical protein